jgi:hypothetical protein
MVTLFAIAVAGWLIAVVATALFRKPNKPFLATLWTSQRPSDYLTPAGLFLWSCGVGMFLVGSLGIAALYL